MNTQYYLRHGNDRLLYMIENGELYFYGGAPKCWRISSYEFKDLCNPKPITKEEAFAIML